MRELTHAVLVACLMMTGSLLAQALTPTVKLAQQIGEPRFTVMVPAQLGEWSSLDTDLDAIVDPQTQQPGRKLNSVVLKRIYANPAGERVMLLLAYVPDLGPTLHAYRPEALYPAQGWAVRGQRDGTLELPQGRLALHHLEAARDSRQREAVSYLQLVGTRASHGVLHAQLIRFGYSSENLEPDGLILRLSSALPGSAEPDGDSDGSDGSTDSAGARARALHGRFLAALVGALKPEARERLSGLASTASPPDGRAH
ncbi:MAG: EpsI family protein [Pseudomonadota bacterium]